MKPPIPRRIYSTPPPPPVKNGNGKTPRVDYAPFAWGMGLVVAGVRTFNHLHAWAGIGMAAAGAILFAKGIVKTVIKLTSK